MAIGQVRQPRSYQSIWRGEAICFDLVQADLITDNNQFVVLMNYQQHIY